MPDCLIQIPEMQPKPLAELVQDIRGALIAGDAAVEIRHVAFDSRDVRPRGLFVAMRGGYVDGHDYLAAALSAGACAAVVEHDTPISKTSGFQTTVRVDGTRAALAQIAVQYFEAPSSSMRVVGVTGTDGKTTTSHMIDAICRASGRRTGLVGTVVVRVGQCEELHESRQTTPESLHVHGYLAAMRAERTDVAILEATSHGLAMHRVDGCDFDVGVITNITHEHLDFHGSVEAYRLAKASLLERVAAARSRGKLGVAVLNADDAGTREVQHLAVGCEVMTFSRNPEARADLNARDVEQHQGGSAFVLRTPQGETHIDLPIPGRYNVANALAAAGATIAMGMTLDDVAQGLRTLPRVPGRMDVVDEGQPFTVIVDYAHTPEALATLLRDVRPTVQGRLYVLFGSAGERDVAKRAIQGRVGVEHADFAMYTSEDPRFEDAHSIIADIAQGAVEAGRRRGVHFDCIEDRAEAIRALLGRAAPGDVVVLAGKGHEHSMIYGAERRPWDEAEQARSTLRAMGYAKVSQESYPEEDLR